jgi:alkanesulfonate monooxygenase SsuD/methylene tetrahydromethanopterin reductase-like flavin-dependent oxidoreductase (luciferase family)
MAWLRRPLLGVFAVPEAAQLATVREQVAVADRAGLDLVGIQDHPYQRRYVDTWTLMAHLAARTERVRFVTDVANLPLRPPAVMAKAAATLDLLSDGRFELGLGAGAFWEAIAAYGGEALTPAQSVDALEEAIAIIRLMWSGERSATFEGTHYRVRGARPGPAPAHPIGIWLGAYGPRMMRVVGRIADGWLPSLPRLALADVPAKHDAIDEAAAAAGRDPSAIVRVANVSGTITDGATGDWPTGPPERWIEELARLIAELRFDGFVFWPTEGDAVAQTRRFAEEVAPAVRAGAQPPS